MEAIEHHKTTPHYQAMAQAVGDLLAHREVLLLDELSVSARFKCATACGGPEQAAVFIGGRLKMCGIDLEQ